MGAAVPQPRKPRSPWRAAVAGLLLLGALVAALIFGLASQRGARSGLAGTPGTHLDPALLEQAVTPVAVVVYPIRRGFRLSTLDELGRPATCLDGPKDLLMLDLAHGTIVYTDGQTVSTVLLNRCAGTPRRLASFRSLTHRRPTEGEGIMCASISPEGSRILLSLADNEKNGFWMGAIDGTHWRFIPGNAACSWIDDRHALSEPVGYGVPDRVAVDVNSGTISFIDDPGVFEGSRSPDGRDVAFLDGTTLEVADRVTGVTRPIADKQDYFSPVPHESLWNSDGSRLLVSTGSGYTVYDVQQFTHLQLNVDKDASVGWFSDSQLWSTGDGLELVDTLSGFTDPIDLPDSVLNDQTPDPDVFVAAERQGVLPEDSGLVSRGQTPLQALPSLGLQFHRPPSWRVSACKTNCGIEGYRASLQLGRQGSDSQILFGSTYDTVRRASARILREAGALAPCDKRRMACLEYDVESETLGAIRFTRIDIYGDEGSETIFLARIHGRTTMIDCDPSDPSTRLVLDSLRTT